MGSGGECHTRMTMQERRTGTWGAAGDEDAPTGAAARMGSLKSADGAVVAAGSFPAEEGGCLEAGVELAPWAWSLFCPLSEGVSCMSYSQTLYANGNINSDILYHWPQRTEFLGFMA